MFVSRYLQSTGKMSFRIGEVAKMFRVHHATVRYWADTERIPVHRTVGGHRRITRETVLLIGASMNQA